MITSNLVFSEWDQIFQNRMTTAAAIDRLVHHSVILEFDVASYRIANKSRSAGDSGVTAVIQHLLAEGIACPTPARSRHLPRSQLLCRGPGTRLPTSSWADRRLPGGAGPLLTVHQQGERSVRLNPAPARSPSGSITLVPTGKNSCRGTGTGNCRCTEPGWPSSAPTRTEARRERADGGLPERGTRLTGGVVVALERRCRRGSRRTPCRSSPRMHAR
ncbi:MAG: ATP-binding protein [Myxococcota bacterium]